MQAKSFQILADWDPEAQVWVATSEDVPGLATEALTLEALAEKLGRLIPELLEANGVLPTGPAGEIAFQITSHRQETIRLAS